MHGLMRELAGNICHCGKPKVPRQTFCRSCYYRLPAAMRAALYRRMGEGYEEAYAAAVTLLFGAKSQAESVVPPKSKVGTA